MMFLTLGVTRIPAFYVFNGVAPFFLFVTLRWANPLAAQGAHVPGLDPRGAGPADG